MSGLNSPFWVGAGQSRRANAMDAAREACRQAMKGATSHQAGWLFAFFTPHHAARADEMRHLLLAETGAAALAGSSAPQVIGPAGELEDEPGLVVLAGGGGGVAAAGDVLPEGREVLEGFFDRHGPGLLTLFPDGERMAGQRLLDRLAPVFDGFPVAGASSTGSGGGAGLQMGASGLRQGTVAALALAGVEVAIGMTGSCLPVGQPRFITGLEERLLTQLDGRPAWEVYREACEAHGLDDFAQAMGQILLAVPLNPENPSFAPEDCLVRPVVGVRLDSNALEVGLGLDKAPCLSLMAKSQLGAERDMGLMLKKTASRLSGPPQAGLYFRSVARGSALFGRQGTELEAIRHIFPGIALAGMAGGFEIATLHGAPRLQTHSGVLILIRQKG